MKVSAIQTTYQGLTRQSFAVQKNRIANEKHSNTYMPYFTPNLNFGIANAGKLKALFSYGLPCMYSGIEMIDPKKVQRLMKSGVFNKPISEVLPILLTFEDSIIDIEKRVFNIIKEQAEIEPDKTLLGILQTLAPTHNRRLVKKQNVILHELSEVAQDLPEHHRYMFKQFMRETHDKLESKPVMVPFSSFEFKYKLDKIREDISKNHSIKANKVISKLIKESNGLSTDTNSRTIDTQQKVIRFMEIVLNSSVLKDYKPLRDLITVSKDKLDGKKVKIPFARKSFIYDLAKLLKDLPDKDLQERLLLIAQKMPTSRENTSAYILKFSTEPSEKIAYRLLWPNIASVEHIYPRSCGGIDAMSNFGGAGARENAERGNIDFVSQIKHRPGTPRNCQKYVDRLIQYAKSGILAKVKVENKYIEQFKKRIQEQSRGSIVLDTSKLYTDV